MKLSLLEAIVFFVLVFGNVASGATFFFRNKTPDQFTTGGGKIQNEKMKKTLIFAASLIICNYIIDQNLYKGDKCIIKSEFIYHPEEVQFPSCHASTIAETSDGLVAAWFGGY